jgi:hypothetical protein
VLYSSGRKCRQKWQHKRQQPWQQWQQHQSQEQQQQWQQQLSLQQVAVPKIDWLRY